MNNITCIITKDGGFDVLERHLLEHELNNYKCFVEKVIGDDELSIAKQDIKSYVLVTLGYNP